MRYWCPNQGTEHLNVHACKRLLLAGSRLNPLVSSTSRIRFIRFDTGAAVLLHPPAPKKVIAVALTESTYPCQPPNFP